MQKKEIGDVCTQATPLVDTPGAKNVLRDDCLGESAEIINGVFVHLAGTMAKCPLTEGLL